MKILVSLIFFTSLTSDKRLKKEKFFHLSVSPATWTPLPMRRSLSSSRGATEDLSQAKRYFFLFCIKPQIFDFSLNKTSDQFLSMADVWINEENLTRVLYGPNFTCNCEYINHAQTDLRFLNEKRGREKLANLIGVDRYNFEQMRRRDKRLNENHVFLDEYGANFRIHQAIHVPCNAERRAICLHFSRWFYEKVKLLHQSYRTRNMQIWERSVQKCWIDQCRANNSLNQQCREANARFERLKLSYENVIREKKPMLKKNVTVCLVDK